MNFLCMTNSSIARLSVCLSVSVYATTFCQITTAKKGDMSYPDHSLHPVSFFAMLHGKYFDVTR